MRDPRHRKADVLLRDGSTVHVRPVRVEDAPAVQAFFEAYHRSRSCCGSSAASPTSTAPSAGPPKSTNTAAAWSPPAPTAAWSPTPAGKRDPDRPERAEIAFAIADAMQHNGLGTILLGQLIEAADQAGVAVLSAEVLPQNHRMIHVFRDSGFLSPPARSQAWSWWNWRPRGRRRRWSASNHATAYQATANDAPALFRCLGA